MRKSVATDNAPKAIGPYSQAIVHNGMAYLSGQIPLDPATGNKSWKAISPPKRRVYWRI